MSFINGKFECDRCGTDVGNGGIQMAVVLTYLDEELFTPVNMHFCLDRIENNKKVHGCKNKILSPSNTAHYRNLKENVQ